MMTSLRSQMKTILWILVFAFLATIVFSWGMGGFKERNEPGVIGTVAGDKISAEAFERFIQNKVDAAQRKDSTTYDETKVRQLRDDSWDEEVERMLKEKDAEKHDIKVSDNEIAYIVQNYPPNEVRQVQSFQREGKFAPDLYLAFLKTAQAQQFLMGLEQSVRNYLLEQKVQFHVEQATDVSDQLVKDEWIRAGAKAKFRFVMIPFDKVDVDSNSITQAMLERYYNLFPERYKQYPQRQFAYVKFKLEPSPEDSADVRRAASDVLDELKKGADFAALAKERSDDPGSGAKGGDLDWFGHGAMAKPFEDAAFAATPNEIIGPVESRFGLHVIQVLEKKTEDGEDKVHARHILLKYKASPDTRDGVHAVAYAFAQDAQLHGFDAVAAGGNYNIDTTKDFSEAGYIAGLGRMRMAAEFCFHSKVGTLSDVYTVPDGYVVFKITKATEETTKPLADVRDQIQKSVLRILRQQRAWDMAASMRAKMNVIADLSNVAAAAGFHVYETGDSVKVDDKLPEGLRADKDFVSAAFRVNEGDISDVIEGKQGYYIAAMIFRIAPSDEDYSNNHFAIYSEMLRKEQDAISKNWVRELRIASKIEDMRYKYYRDF
jgi:peptidyl-prolyl cis-trans isomerase D